MNLLGNIDGGVVSAFIIRYTAGIRSKCRQLVTKYIGNRWNLYDGFLTICINERVFQHFILQLMIMVVLI